jgi:hypothetical protein
MALAYRARGKFPGVRRFLYVGLGLVAAGCGGGSDERQNLPRPAPPVTMTAAVQDDVVRISPRAVGAGQVTFIVSNQSGRPQKVTVETDELGGKQAGTTATSPVIPAGSTGRVTLRVREGNYSVHVADNAIRAARLTVGPPRRSGQDQLLLP